MYFDVSNGQLGCKRISRKTGSSSECRTANKQTPSPVEMLASLLPVSISGAQSGGFGILPGSSLRFPSSLGLTCSSAIVSCWGLNRRRTVKPLEKSFCRTKTKFLWFYNTRDEPSFTEGPGYPAPTDTKCN